MMDKYDMKHGGQAFPFSAGTEPGMTLREYIAVEAMKAMIISRGDLPVFTSKVAVAACQQADALLAEMRKAYE